MFKKNGLIASLHWQYIQNLQTLTGWHIFYLLNDKKVSDDAGRLPSLLSFWKAQLWKRLESLWYSAEDEILNHSDGQKKKDEIYEWAVLKPDMDLYETLLRAYSWSQIREGCPPAAPVHEEFCSRSRLSLKLGEDSCSCLRLQPLSQRSLRQLHFLCLKPSLELFTVERSYWADIIWMKNNKIQTFKQSLSTNNCMDEQ